MKGDVLYLSCGLAKGGTWVGYRNGKFLIQRYCDMFEADIIYPYELRYDGASWDNTTELLNAKKEFFKKA